MKWNRNDWRTLISLVSAVLALGAASFAVAAQTRPNVILLLVDDMGWTGPHCYGSDLHETPNIDRLASQGVRFTDAYAAAPVCSPTRASIMTGKSPARLHMTIWRESAINKVHNRKLLPPNAVENLPQSEVTIAEALQSAGYFTAHVGKWHLGNAENYPENHGFRLDIGGTLWGCPATFFYPFAGPFGSDREMRYIPGLPWAAPGDYLTDRLTDEALKIIDAVGDRPFFLNMCYYTVHTPIEAKSDMVAHYAAKLRGGLVHVNPTYAAMHQSLDESVGRILAKLEQRGIADRTVVIFSSDNGGFINEYRGTRVTSNRPLRSGKGSLYEGGVRVPLIVRWPGVTQPGGVCHEPVVSTDFYPTLLEATHLAADGVGARGLEGTSLAPLLKDPEASLDRNALYFHYPHYYPTTTPVSAIRARDWKLLEFYEDRHIELYDLKSDVGEMKNLASSMPEKANDLRDRLHAWLTKVAAQMPTPNPSYPAGKSHGAKS